MSALAPKVGEGSHLQACCRDCDWLESTRDDQVNVRRQARRHAAREHHTVDVDRTVFATYSVPSQDGTEAEEVEPARCAECGGHLGIEGGGGGAEPCECGHDDAAQDGTEAAR